MIRKHSARCIKYVNDQGKMEAMCFIAGTWRLAGFTSDFDGEFHWINEPVKEVLKSGGRFGYSTHAVAKWAGMPINKLLSKSFIREWTTNQAVYGVPF